MRNRALFVVLCLLVGLALIIIATLILDSRFDQSRMKRRIRQLDDHVLELADCVNRLAAVTLEGVRSQSNRMDIIEAALHRNWSEYDKSEEGGASR